SKNAFAISEPLPVQSAETAYEEVLANVGAVLPKRDAVDLRVVNETKTGTATGTGSYGRPGIIDDPSAVLGWPVYNSGTAPVDTDKDGIPDVWEDANGLNKNNVE